MRNLLGLVILFIGVSSFAQSKNYNTKKGYIASGFDVVAYFSGEAKEGDKIYSTEYKGVKLKFVSDENLETFKSNPIQYLPKYGGYCAYAMAINGSKVSINPETFEIRDGVLYLFYNSGRNNTLESWLKEQPERLKAKADMNWEKIKKK